MQGVKAFNRGGSAIGYHTLVVEERRERTAISLFFAMMLPSSLLLLSQQMACKNDSYACAIHHFFLFFLRRREPTNRREEEEGWRLWCFIGDAWSGTHSHTEKHPLMTQHFHRFLLSSLLFFHAAVGVGRDDGKGVTCARWHRSPINSNPSHPLPRFIR